MKRLQQFLASHPVISLDSAVFIYHLEDHPRYAPLTEIIFTALEKGANKGITSYLTLMEVLTKPKAEGFTQAVRDYEYYLTTFPNLTFFEMDLEVARRASDLRAVQRIKAPDAIQIATALLHSATGFLTNDKIFERIKDIDILIFDKLLT
jgi:predicted nucleic acid-binding protein